MRPTWARQNAGLRSAGLNHEYARKRRSDEQQLQETAPPPHGSHLLSDVTRTPVSLLMKRRSRISGYEDAFA